MPALVATVNGTRFRPGEPILLRLRLTNTLGRTVYIAYTARLSDWHPRVDWLGADGRGAPVPAPLTPAGVREVSPPVAVFLVVMPLPPGSVRDAGPVTLNALFDMSRPGVYAIRAARRVSFTGSWARATDVASAPVRVVVE